GDERTAVHLWKGLSCNFPFRRRRDGIFRGQILRQSLASRQFRIGQRTFRNGVSHLCVCSNQPFRRNPPFLGCHTDEQIARRLRNTAELRRHRGRGTAAERDRKSTRLNSSH